MAVIRSNEPQQGTWIMNRKPWKAVILDMDGVITQTARVHARAWKTMFDQYLEQRSSRGQDVQEPFDIQRDYHQYVDGKSRNDGVRSFLKSRGIQIPDGDQSEEPNWDTISGLGNHKNVIFHELLQEEGVQVYEDTVEQIQKWKREGLKIAVISSSRNCEAVLKAVRLLDVFDAKVDGNDVAELGLNGKPSPDTFLRAAQLLVLNQTKRWSSRTRFPASRPVAEVSSGWWWESREAARQRRIDRRARIES